MRPVRPVSFWAAVPLLLFAGQFAYAFAFRVGYPFGLEWMEGDLLVAAHRLAHGEAVYSRPDQWIPYFYPPLYLLLWAPLVQLFGPVLWPGRVLSLLASLAAGLALCGYVRARTGRRDAGLLAMGLFWGFYQYTGQWLDLCRVDPLMLAMVSGGLYAYARSRTSDRAAWRIAAVLLLGSALLAKQNGTAFLLAVGLADLLAHRPEEAFRAFRQGRLGAAGLFRACAKKAEFLLAGGALALFWVGLGQGLTEGWYWDYLYAMPGRLEHRNLFVLIFVLPTLRHALPLALVLLVWSATACRRGGGVASERRLELLLLLFGALASLPVTFKYGAYYNNLLPLMLAMCAVGGVLLGDALAAGGKVRRWAIVILALQVGVLLCVNRPNEWRPNRDSETLRAAERVLPELLDQLGDRVWLLSHPYLNLQRGHPTYIKGFAAYEFVSTGGQLPEKWHELIRQKHFRAIIADIAEHPLDPRFELYATIREHYELFSTLRYGDEALPERARALAPRSGAFTRPTYFWIPKGSLPPLAPEPLPQ